MKTLKTLQTLAKIGKILSTVAFVLCIVGGALCLLGIPSLAIIPEGFKIDGTTIQGLVQQKAGWSLTSCCLAMAQGIVFCAGEAVLAKFAQRYFDNEMKAGTPFTFDGAKELMRLGILAIAISVGTSILAGIAYGITTLIVRDLQTADFDNSASIIIGVMMIVGSFLCRHGAEVSEKPEEPQAA